MAVPYTFATATSAIPLSQLDSNFSTPITIGNTSVQLGNTVTTLNNMTLGNVTISSVASTFPNNYLANSTATLGNSTITLGGTTSSVGNLTLVNATISSGTYSVTDATVSGNLTLSGGTANGVVYLNGSKVATSGSALTFDGTNFGVGGAATSIAGTVMQTTGTTYAFNVVSDATATVKGQLYADHANDVVGIGSRTNHPVIFQQNNAEQMRLTSTGLGIGTSSPQVQLHLQSDAPIIRLTDTSANTNAEIYCNSAAGSMYLRADKDNTAANSLIGFQIDGSDKMTLDASGNLGLGVAPSAWGSPFVALQVSRAGLRGSTDAMGLSYNAYYDGSGFKYIASSRYATDYYQNSGQHVWSVAPTGTAGNAITFTQAMTLDASGFLSVGTTTARAMVTAQSDLGTQNSFAAVNTGTTYGQGYMFARFMNSSAAYAGSISHTASTGIGVYSAGDLILGASSAEKARIDSSGNLTVPGVYSATVGGTNRDVYVDNTGLLGYVSSVRASKTNIADIADTSWLLKLNPVSFNYRKKDEDGNYTEEADGPIEFGLIAEDTESVKPELCFYDEVDGEQVLRGISYSKLITPMLKHIQKLEERIAALEAK